MINQMLDVLAYEDHNVLDFETVQFFFGTSHVPCDILSLMSK